MHSEKFCDRHYKYNIEFEKKTCLVNKNAFKNVIGRQDSAMPEPGIEPGTFRSSV